MGKFLSRDINWVPKLVWWANGHTLQTDIKVLPLRAYDAILGYDWLKPHSPMTGHWDNRTMSIKVGP
jgi:hypothetical protein